MAGVEEDDYGYGAYGARATWLDRGRLAELGFDVSVPADDSQADRHYQRQLPREVLVVLELNGPAYQAALRRATERAARPGATQSDTTYLASERERFSRLFVVDAGREYDSLRARYPDKSRYAIVRGKIRVDRWSAKTKAGLHGYVSELSVSALNVPVELRDVLARNASGYGATVIFGQRLEPWFTAAQKTVTRP